MSEEILRGVCVGAGYFSRFQYEAWKRIPEVEIVANCNRSLEPAQQYAEEFGVPACDIFRTSVEPLTDAVIQLRTQVEESTE